MLDQIEITLRNTHNDLLPVYIDVHESSLSKKWLNALDSILADQLVLEKNYCFLGFTESDRSGEYILQQVNQSIQAINESGLDYHIDDHFTMADCITDDPIDGRTVGRNLVHDRMNWLHRYFEDLQGSSSNISSYYVQADPTTRWHIRQLNLLCHEFESWALSYRKEIEAPEWRRPSQLMCWLNAPRFVLDDEDYELFGIETISRSLGGVFVGVNKAVGKHHWEVFCDEGGDSRVDELVTTSLASQTEAAGDFDIEWAQDPSEYHWQKQELKNFREWLINNGFDPDDKSLTIGHPKVGQVDLARSFGTTDFKQIWNKLGNYLDVHSVKTAKSYAEYDYRWSDNNFVQLQVDALKRG